MPAPTVFSLCYVPDRAHRIRSIVDLWLRRARRPEEVEIVVALAADDREGRAVVSTLPGCVRVVIEQETPSTRIQKANAAAAASAGQVLIAVSDDVTPPEAWDEKLRALAPGWMELEQVVHIDDGVTPTVMGVPILTRRRYARLGYLFYPGYVDSCAEVELTERAYLDEIVLQAPQLLFRRECSSPPSFNATDHALLLQRTALDFPLDAGPVHERARRTLRLPVGEKFAVHLLAIRDDFNLTEVTQRLYDEGIRAFFFALPSHYWSGRKNEPENESAVRAVAARWQAWEGVRVEIHAIDIGGLVGGSRSRLQIETWVRNRSIAAIQEAGFDHILVIDGDELWRRGSVRELDEVLRTQTPAALGARCIPVIGVPGFPVDQAREWFLVYLRAGTGFRFGRSVFGVTHQWQHRIFFHFAATRRTLAAVVEKHRQSGHFDDPRFRFAEFLEETLPRAQPGLKDLSYAEGPQLWPELRHWRRDEVDDLPPALHALVSLETIDPPQPDSDALSPVIELPPETRRLLPHLPPTNSVRLRPAYVARQKAGWLEMMSVGTAGERVGPEIQTAVRGAAGYVFYGPYEPLPPGAYRLHIFFSRCGGPRSWLRRGRSPIRLDVTGGLQELAACPVTARHFLRRAISLEFEVADQSLPEIHAPEIEFRLWTDGRTSFAVHRIEVTPVRGA